MTLKILLYDGNITEKVLDLLISLRLSFIFFILYGIFDFVLCFFHCVFFRKICCNYYLLSKPIIFMWKCIIHLFHNLILNTQKISTMDIFFLRSIVSTTNCNFKNQFKTVQTFTLSFRINAYVFSPFVYLHHGFNQYR